MPLAVADPRESPPAPPPPPTDKNCFHFMQFLRKSGTYAYWRPPKGWRPLLRRIMDSPLPGKSLIHNCLKLLISSWLSCCRWHLVVWVSLTRENRLERSVRNTRRRRKFWRCSSSLISLSGGPGSSSYLELLRGSLRNHCKDFLEHWTYWRANFWQFSKIYLQCLLSYIFR